MTGWGIRALLLIRGSPDPRFLADTQEVNPLTTQPGDARVALSLARFLITSDLPDGWAHYDLYIIRDDDVAFYVGQSDLAFRRVWAHLEGGFKGRSTVGRFVLLNWPAALQFTVALLSSAAEQFAPLGDTRDAAEQHLLETLAPCFNAALNRAPTPLPRRYTPPDARVRHPRSLRRMIADAEHAVHLADGRRACEW